MTEARVGSVHVVGSANMDLVVRTPRLPTPGETRRGHSFDASPGGKGANQAVAAARLGAEVRMTGRVGDDAYGRTLLQVLASEGVDVTGVATDPDHATGVALITVAEGDGENTIVVAPGANAAVTTGDVEHAARHWTDGSIVLLQLELPLTTVTRAIELGRDVGARVVVNAAPARPLPRALLELVEVLIVNEPEAAQLVGDDAASAPELAARLADLAAAAIVTLGARGAVGRDAAGSFEVSAPVLARAEVVDTVGAGDAFTGAIAARLAAGATLRDTLTTACRAGACAVTRRGAISSLPRIDEL